MTATGSKLQIPSEHTYIGKAVIKDLEASNLDHHETLWASTTGKIIGDIGHGPKKTWDQAEDPTDGHTNWLPETIASLLASTEIWCDFMSLSPPTPDGLFESKIRESLATLAKKSQDSGKKIVVRFLFANVIAVPTNCDALLESFTKGLPVDSKLEIWVGAWRKGMCWNHAKIVAIDGRHVFTGGHNLWDDVYLKKDPIHDTSIQLEGEVAIKAHNYANEQWKFVQDNQETVKGWLINKVSDGWLVPTVIRVTISEWPDRATTFAPNFEREHFPTIQGEGSVDAIPLLALGRYGTMIGEDARSSDDAFITMFDSAKKSIRLLLQDIGPLTKTVLTKKIIYKSWPKNYMRAWGRAIFDRGVNIEIVLSNTGAGEERGSYSHGWTCEEVAAEIVKTMRDDNPSANMDVIKKKAVENLHVCFIKNKKGDAWEDGNKVGLHSKFFIIDDLCTYVGSQNLYMFDLAEWGVAIDNEEKTAEILKTLWNPLWSSSYLNGCDCDGERVMLILDENREPNDHNLKDKEYAEMDASLNLDTLKRSAFHHQRDSSCVRCVIS